MTTAADLIAAMLDKPRTNRAVVTPVILVNRKRTPATNGSTDPVQEAVDQELLALPEGFDLKARSMIPRNYQVEGIQFLRSGTKRKVLSDAPGLGKTFQGSEAAETPCVITCPKGLVGQWEEFIKDQYPGQKVAVAASGNIIKRDAAIKSDWDWLIINHDAWRTLWVDPKRVKTVIADEFHHFRNRSAKRSRVFANFARAVPQVSGLSATPVYKDVGDLWHLLHILDPQTYKSENEFLSKHAVTLDHGYGRKVIRVKNQKRLDEEISKYIMGRTYAQVGRQLPKRIDKHVVIPMEEGMMTVYKRLRDEYILQMTALDDTQRFMNAGAVLHELRKFTVTKEKLEAAKDIVEDTPGGLEAPIVVFVWYKDTAAKVAAALDGVVITGDEDASTRRHLAQHGRTAKQPPEEAKRVRVCTQASVSEGIDISHARTVLYIEETYVPGQQYQAVSRVIRDRNDGGADTSPVLVHWLRHKGTVDEVVFQTARRRLTGNALTVLKEALEQD